MATLRKICAWCPLYGRVPAVLEVGDTTSGARVSHGICAACAAAERQADAECVA